jgi:glycosyltransferase involved in cell wall biosynthesis
MGFVFVLSDGKDTKYFNKLLLLIEERGVVDNFLFLTEECQFYPILMKSTLFVRPTNTDGDALSIREAISYNIPAVSSNVVTRPKEAVLFKNRDINDLYEKVEHVLINYKEYKEKLYKMDAKDNRDNILKVYKNLTKVIN